MTRLIKLIEYVNRREYKVVISIDDLDRVPLDKVFLSFDKNVLHILHLLDFEELQSLNIICFDFCIYFYHKES